MTSLDFERTIEKLKKIRETIARAGIVLFILTSFKTGLKDPRAWERDRAGPKRELPPPASQEATRGVITSCQGFVTNKQNFRDHNLIRTQWLGLKVGSVLLVALTYQRLRDPA